MTKAELTIRSKGRLNSVVITMMKTRASINLGEKERKGEKERERVCVCV